MELQHLRTFAKVAESGGLTQAAESLYLSQPAVSAQIKALEVELGITLFRRAARGMLLTEAGQRLLLEAQDILLRTDSMTRLAEQLRNQVAGPLQFGIIDCGYDLHLPPIIGLMSQHHPDVDVQVMVANSGDHQKALLDQDIDIAIVESQHLDGRFLKWRIGTSRLGVIGPMAWQKELAQAQWAHLSEYPWIFQSKTCSYYAVIQHIMTQHHITIKPKFQVENIKTIKDLVAEGLALSIADLDSVEKMASEKRIFIWSDFEVEMPVWLVALEARAKDPKIQAFSEIVKKIHGARSPYIGKNGKARALQPY